jgi:hypothetical protein
MAAVNAVYANKLAALSTDERGASVAERRWEYDADNGPP